MRGQPASLTVLLPVRSFHPRFLRAAVGSILDQSAPSWRLLVVCEPESVEAVSTLLPAELADPRVELIENRGRRLPGALNTGMQRADTPFVAVLLGDDLWAREAVAVLTRAVERSPHVDFFHTSRAIIDEHDRPISSVHAARADFSLADFVHGSPVKHLLCWRREKALEIGGLDERGIIGPDDWDFPWRMAEAGAVFEPIQDCLYLYRDHRESFRLTTHVSLAAQSRDLQRMLRKHGVGRLRSRLVVRGMKRRYLRQCLYRNALDRTIKVRLLRRAPRDGWRDTYR